MTDLQNLGDLAGSTISYIVPFLFVLCVVVFFHELGHFLVARWCGVRVQAFSLGFGPELFGRNDKHGTRWRVSAIPLGGYVKFYGDENAASVPSHERLEMMSPEERRKSFYGQPVRNRAAIVAAGPIANFILAILIFATIFWISGRPISEAKVDTVQPGSAAEEAGFQPGDVVLAIGGSEIESFSDVQRVVSADAGAKLTFTIRRDGREVTLQATPRLQERKDPFGNTVQVGILGITRSSDPGTVTRKTYGPVGALREGAHETWFIVERTLGYIGGVLVGQQSADQISGPIRIAEISGRPHGSASRW
jgi:regulator of sigma E protease